MKKIINKNIIFSFILGGLIFGGIVYGSELYNAKDITYSNENSEVTNVNEALDNLYLLNENFSKIKTGSYSPTTITWTEFDIGFRPKYFMFYTVGHDPSGTSIPFEGLHIEEVYNGLDSRYVVLTDTGFKHNPVQANFARNTTFWWFAATDE